MSRSARPVRAAIALPAALDPAALTLLATIDDAGSLTAAARALGATQSALSKQLQRLERSLGVTLFDRSMRGVVPTEYGAALLPRARAIRAQVHQAVEEVAQMRGRREGQVAIAVSHMATLALLPHALARFRADWPGVRIRIAPPTFQFAGLREGSPDFAVMSLPSERLGAEYVTRALHTTTVVAVARPGHPLARSRTLAALAQAQAQAQAQWIMPSLDSSTSRALARAFARARLPAPDCPVTCETLTGLESIVATSDLIGAIPLEVHEARARASGLLRLPLEGTIEGSRVAIVRWADGRPTPAAAALEELFVEAAHRLARRRRRTS